MKKDLLGKGKFIQQCCIELLADGKPHSHSEIRAYAIEKAKGTNLEEELQKNTLTSYIDTLMENDAHYVRTKHDVYQWKADITEQETLAKPSREESVEKSEGITEPKLLILTSAFTRVETLFSKLEKELKDVYTMSGLVDKQKAEDVEEFYKDASSNIKRAIDDVAIWRANYEYDEAEALKEYDEVDSQEEEGGMKFGS